MPYQRFALTLCSLTLLIWSSVWGENGKRQNNLFFTDDQINHTLHTVKFKNGKIVIQDEQNSIPLKFLPKGFSKNIILDSFPLTITADFSMPFIYIYNEVGEDTIIYSGDSTITIWLPEGMYGLITSSFPTVNEEILITKDSLNLNMPVQIQITEQEANTTMQFELVKETGAPLYISTLTFYFTNRIKETGVAIANFGSGITPFYLKYNYLSGTFEKEWAAKGKQGFNNGNLYLISGELFNNQTDTLISNNPSNLVWADFYYHFPDSVEERGNIQVMTLFPDFHTWDGGDIVYHHPVHLKVYQDTSVNFSLLSSTFKQSISAPNVALWSFLWTPEIRIGNQNVTGYFHFDREAISFSVSERIDKVHIGLTPAYWFGKFFNQPDTIKIRSPYGRFVHLFLSQSNDILRHVRVSYQIFEDNSLIKEGWFPTWSPAPLIFLGFNPDSLTIPVSTAAYKMLITDHDYQLIGQAGISQVKAVFDLSKADKNPPNIVLFQILANHELANIVNTANNNKIRFILEDENTIEDIRLLYATWDDTLWNEIQVTKNAPYWEGEIPSLTNGFFSLRLIVRDNSQNYIDCLMAPGFLVDNTTGIVPEELISGTTNSDKSQLHLFNYPNPFNSQTTIYYYVPESFQGELILSIFNILGQEIIRLVKGKPVQGDYTINWDGTDRYGNEVTSGIYFIALEGGEKFIRRKVLVIR